MLKGALPAACLVLVTACGNRDLEPSSFIFHEDANGIELAEKGQKVLFYQIAPVVVEPNQENPEEARFNHYIHPLYNLDGTVITEAQPASDPSHPHHRGIFWAWHQLIIDGEAVGDSWTMEDISYEIQEVLHKTDDEKAILSTTVQWITGKSGLSIPFVEEKTSISVYPSGTGMRMIDFDIGIRGLLPGVQIGGSIDTIKGYGGFSARIALADSMIFLSGKGPVQPVTGQVEAGSWVDFSTPLLKPPKLYGFSIFCHPSNPGHPSPWLLRRENSMQNPAYPGFELATLSTTSETLLRYRLVIHDGHATKKEIETWYGQYAKSAHPDSKR